MSFKKAIESLQKTVNSVFGTEMIYASDETSEVTVIKGVFDNSHIDSQGVDTRRPIIRITLSDLPDEPAEGDFVTIDLVEYSVLGHEPDSFGATTIHLQKI